MPTVKPSACPAARYMDLRSTNPLQHLQAIEQLVLPRLTRDAGQALCSRTLRLLDDAAMWPEDDTAQCPRCWAIAERHGLTIATKPEPRGE